MHLLILAGVSAVLGYTFLLYILFRRPTQESALVRRLARGCVSAGMLYALALLALLIMHTVAPQRSGLPALTQVFAPYLFAPLAPLAPFALLREGVLLRWLLLASLCVGAARFFPPLRLSAPVEEPGATQVRVLHWNVAPGRDSTQIPRVRPLLYDTSADVVVLAESYWKWLDHEKVLTQRYPHQLKHTDQSSTGLVLLSVYPIVERGVAQKSGDMPVHPRLIWARLDLGGGKQLLVIAAHPESPYATHSPWQFPPVYDARIRDSYIPHIRALVDPALARGEHVLLMGDLNLTEREPAYDEVARGLQDAHLQVGNGSGATWGLIPKMNWSLPLLRIDYFLSSPNVTPLDMSVDCTLRKSDHCVLTGRFQLDE
jgi:endonuclease/exonuclease/phosphatase family metal-dependent hydrolase